MIGAAAFSEVAAYFGKGRQTIQDVFDDQCEDDFM
jgi:hypothetical protein